MKNTKPNKPIKIGINVLFLSLILGAGMIFFDDDYQNDHKGWILLLIFWGIRSVISLIKNVRDVNKVLVVADLLLITLAVGFLCWQAIGNWS
ncbi:hypothetical protein CN378_12275 [Bacillus sp. AFS015802]|uniref:hypothetical protein n=1 Tax=Bacillus sp. AFS015802 TaxID=2033486 RepID=UPI000BF3013D|nr:hypothetical protein [Bacillus sp. AFS015802]PFA67144.1 hypothetical protein CN378_12275 [Bacillus sp. AFS015802]